jgi:hypothetical protein
VSQAVYAAPMLIVGLAPSNDPSQVRMAENIRYALEEKTGQEVYVILGCTALMEVDAPREPIDVTPMLEEAEQEDA